MKKRRESLALWVALSRAYEAVAEVARRHAERHGLLVTEFGVLEALHHLGPMRLCDLQRKILVSSGGTTLVVDRLEGREHADEIERAMSALSSEERKTAIRLLRRLTAAPGE